MGISKVFVYNFLRNYAITIHSICLESYDPGLLNKSKYIMSYLLVIEIYHNHCKSTKHLIGFLKHCKL